VEAASKPAAASADRQRAEQQPNIALGMIVAPGLARDVTAKIASELAHDLEALDLGVEWRTELTVDRLVAPPAPTTEIIDAARRKLLDANWDLGVVVTDLPLRVGRRPVARQVSPTHGIAVVSLPALGALHLAPRLRRTLPSSSASWSAREAASGAATVRSRARNAVGDAACSRSSPLTP
jgi:hypothetical protein